MTRFATLTLAALMALAVSVQAAPTQAFEKRTVYQSSSSIDTTPVGAYVPGHRGAPVRGGEPDENERTGDEREPDENERTGDEREPDENERTGDEREPDENEVTGNETEGLTDGA
ncbi:hypothetical protein K492DRAFT_184575 [Lichtheimia hyalospora FSU 10163]|nr:hypothetical protein K492DRAFT_184575 [Lichtheimia hyalospora FSU 10163]